MAEPTQEISPTALAQICNIDVRRVQQLANEGVMFKAKTRGRYLMIQSFNGYAKYLQERVHGSKSKGKSDAVREAIETQEKNKARIAKARADQLEFENQKNANEWIHIGDIEPHWLKICTRVKTSVREIVDKVKEQSNLSAAQEEDIEKIYTDGINALASKPPARRRRSTK